MQLPMIQGLKKMVIIGVPLVMVIIGLMAGLGYYYYQYQQVKKNPTQVSTQEVEQTVKQITRFMDLPAETPTMATVTDITLLKDQPFFANAQNDDKILIYPTDRKVILYRPSTKKVINFAPLNINNEATPQTGASETAATPAPITMAIYNGSEVAGLTSVAQDKLKTMTNINVTTKENAVRKDYQQTIVVDLNGSYGEVATQVANTLGGVVGTLPEGEKKPTTDLLVIVSE